MCLSIKKKKLVDFPFIRPLISYPFFDDIIEFVGCRWEERRNFFSNYKMIYPRLNYSMRWKHDYFFFEKVENNKNVSREKTKC